jgi:hypothetical protein
MLVFAVDMGRMFATGAAKRNEPQGEAILEWLLWVIGYRRSNVPTWSGKRSKRDVTPLRDIGTLDATRSTKSP